MVDLPTSMGITLRSRKRYPGLLIGCVVEVADSIAIAMVRYLVLKIVLVCKLIL